jgi:hypothetical protein
MAVKGEFEAIESFEDWYSQTRLDRDGSLVYSGFTDAAAKLQKRLDYYKREMDARVANYWKYEKMADAAVVNERPDLPNVSSGEAAGFIRRIARAVVQHTPNVTVSGLFDDDGIGGIVATWITKAKIIGDDEYSSNMQQQLYATMVRAATLGFDCVIPTLLQNSNKSWYMQYDNINYRDVFPEPGVKDVRRATAVFVRRYLTRGEVHQLITTQAVGWDTRALLTLLKTSPGMKEYTDHQSKKHRVNSEAYEIMTWYTNSGEPFLTWAVDSRMLLRIEKNKHPLKEHPVFFFVPDYDGEQPFGRSILSLIYGRQEFQDWFLNGAMKLWRLNIEPPIIGYGVVNAIPNIGPGKYTSIPNPNARVEPFEVQSQSLLMFNQIAQANAGNMGQMIGASDQQMAAASGAPAGMSQTPQGVEAQQQMVDTTTNNYQKAMEVFVSRYLSYALTIYFQELKGVKSIAPSADARQSLIGAGVPPEAFIHKAHKSTDDEGNEIDVPDDDTGLEDGQLKTDFSKLAVQHWVKVVPGSLIELEDEKQVRLLNQMLIPLSQAMPALAQTGDQDAVMHATKTIQYIVNKQIELSGSSSTEQLKALMAGTDQPGQLKQIAALESSLSGSTSEFAQKAEMQDQVIAQQQQQLSEMTNMVALLAEKLGVQIPSSAPQGGDSPVNSPAAPATTV